MTSETITQDNSTFLYRFLTSSQYKVRRNALLIAALLVVSMNQTFIVYQSFLELIGYGIFVITAISLATYVMVIYYNLGVLFPRYLLTKRYLLYVSYLSLAMLVALSIQVIQEYIVWLKYPEMQVKEAFFDTARMMDYISSFLMCLFCMIGGTMAVLLRIWMVNNQRVAQLEQAHIRSEVEQLKEQVSTDLLFKTLHRTGTLALSVPDDASEILMKLSHLLRYQLYDCAREKVLLSSEITFLTHYLMLEKFCSDKFDYTLSSEGEVNRTLLPPLLFIPFVQYMVNRILDQQQYVHPTILLRVRGKEVELLCTCHEVNLSVGEDTSLNRIIQRLNLLYQECAVLIITSETIRLQLKGGTK